MNAITQFRKCTLTDQELLKAVDSGIDNMYKENRMPPRHVPARPNEDFDLLIGELMIRFGERIGMFNGHTTDELVDKIFKCDC